MSIRPGLALTQEFISLCRKIYRERESLRQLTQEEFNAFCPQEQAVLRAFLPVVLEEFAKLETGQLLAPAKCYE